MMKKNRLLLFVLGALLCLSATAKDEKLNRKQIKEQASLQEATAFLQDLKGDPHSYSPLERTRIDTIYRKRGLHINFTEEFAYHVLRAKDVDYIKRTLAAQLGLRRWQNLHLAVDGLPLEHYVPNFYSDNKDKSRQDKPSCLQHVQNISQAYTSSQGLNQRHIALWNSHGKYYHHQDSCWKWQRAPLFSTVEDLFTSAYVLPFLVPMLEQAGANVYLPRERDVQRHEVIVDNEDAGFFVQGASALLPLGFQNHLSLNTSTINPFSQGQSIRLGKDARATWQMPVPEQGKYAVYVAYALSQKNTKEAIYKVHHAGGVTTFQVNQQIGAGTWVYLGHFDFDQEAKVVLAGKNSCADAVRLGGGMGDIPREGKLSGVPRWQEAARYYLQYSGALDSLTFNRHGDSIDYNDDFRSRARWVNFLIGDKAIEPWLKNDASITGLQLPIDLSLGLHTDAGHFNGMDTTVGTLAIYSTYDVEKSRDFYYSNTSRLSNRDLADLVQTQIVEDVRALYDSLWTQRELWDKMYSEATFAQVPSMLLEIHGHANAQDMRYGLDPKFRFDVSRAIYKACLRFLSTYHGRDYVVKPLPVGELSVQLRGQENVLQWTPVLDPLEASAVPEAYVVYRKRGTMGWDNGTLVQDTFYTLPREQAGVYSYRVSAVNAGGVSFPSIALSLTHPDKASKKILVIDGFTRIAAPAFVACGDSVGLAPWQDEGVAYGLDIASIGAQYNYDQNDPWRSDEAPGHGGSSFELSDTVFLGNNFSTSYAFANAISALGHRVLSSSAAAVEQGQLALADFDAVVLAYGEQRFTSLPSGRMAYDILSPAMVQLMSSYLDQGGRLFVNGAHLATSTLEGLEADRFVRSEFLKNYCGITFANRVKPQDHCVTNLQDSLSYHYNVAHSKDYYRVENADAFKAEPGADVLDVYHNGLPAAVYYESAGRVISSGLPFEAIVGDAKRSALMRIYLEKLWNEEN